MERIILATATHYHIVLIKDIVYCKSNNSITSFYLYNGQQIVVSTSLKEYEKQLSRHSFFRSHQSYLVNINYICTIDKTNAFSLTLSNGCEIPVSTRKRKELMQLLNAGLQHQDVIEETKPIGTSLS